MTKAYVYWLHLPEHNNMFSEGYIGVSVNPKKRLYEHKRSIDKNTHPNPHIINAFGKYEEIIFSILVEGSQEYCYYIESKLREKENIGWNITMGGAGASSKP